MDRERVRQRREALRQQRNADVPVDDGRKEMELFLVNRSRDAFVARRTENVTKKKCAYKKGRELRYIPAE